MSLLTVRSAKYGSFKMNVLSFTAPVYGTIAAAQTKTRADYFPVKANQPEVEFVVQFSNEYDFANFQKFVRNTQTDALSATSTSNVGVTLWWPERDILNWSGMIRNFAGGAAKWNWAPRAKFQVDLIDSMVTQKTQMASFGSSFSSVWQNVPVSDSIIRPPSLGNSIGVLFPYAPFANLFKGGQQ